MGIASIMALPLPRNDGGASAICVFVWITKEILLRLFLPRFYAIKRNLSMTEAFVLLAVLAVADFA